MARKDLIQTTVTIDPIGPLPGEFRTFTGGEATSPSIKSSPGAGKGEIERGGRQQVSNVTVAREDDGTVDLARLIGLRGKAKMVVHRTPLDDDGNQVLSRQRVYSGKLLEVHLGEGDTMSDTDLDEFELEMGCDSVIG